MKITYRPEIDGLRAVAVGVVILYHARIYLSGQQLFKGGFIGVDVFFVISGYLITSIILKELLTKGSFSFMYFYERRIRRILPALLFVMLVVFPAAWMYILPYDIEDFSKSILYSIGFSSNFYFHYSGLEYDAPIALFKPFLHTWSLSVEEQYYILFPIVLIISFKYFRKYIIHILIIGFTVSLGLADYISRNHSSISFYLLHTRMWELLAGSILSYFELTLGGRSKNKILNLILPSVGLVLIGHSIIFFNDKMFHPSLYTLSPVIGVCLIIWFSNKNEIVTKILSTKLFVGIGLISYSLYLWHYPIFAFARITNFTNENIFKEFSLLLFILILSIISYFFIEKNFRNKKYNFKKLAVVILSSIIFLISINYYVLKEDGVKKRFSKIFQVKLKERNVNFFQKDNLQKIILIGDSHSDSLAYNLNNKAIKNNFSLYRFHTEMYLTDFDLVNRDTKRIKDGFNESNEKIDQFLKKNSDLTIIFHQRWSLYSEETRFNNKEGYKENHKKTSNDLIDPLYFYYLEPVNNRSISKKERQIEFRKGLVSQINQIINQGHKLILIYPVPEMGFNVLKLLREKLYKDRLSLNQNPYPIFTGSYEVFKKRNKLIFEILDSVQSSNIYRIYPHKFFCDTVIKDRCVANDNENIFYYDDDHLSILGANFVINEIIKKIEMIELKLQ